MMHKLNESKAKAKAKAKTLHTMCGLQVPRDQATNTISLVTCIKCRPELADFPASAGWYNSKLKGRRL